MAWFTDMAVNAATGLMNFGLGSAAAEKNASLNYKYNELAADNADRRTRALYGDFMSPTSRIAQLKKAGLSPSLYADGAGAGSQGVTAGAQGSGASGVGIPTNIMQLDAAQIRLANAQAEKAEAEAETERGDNERGSRELQQLAASVSKTIEETNNVGLKNAYMEYENALQSLRLGYEASTFDDKIGQFKNECEYLKYKTKSAKVKADIDEHTQADVEKLVHEDLKNVIADTILKRSQAELNKKGIEVSNQQIQDLISQIENRGKQTDINRDTLNQAIKEWATKNGLIFGNDANVGDYWQKVLFGEHAHELYLQLFKALKGN